MKINYGAKMNKRILQIDGVDSIKAANGNGEGIISELYKFGQNVDTGVFPKGLLWLEKQHAWLDTTKNVIVLFNIAREKQAHAKAVKLVADYVNRIAVYQEKTESTITGGVITTDFGVPISTDKDEALKLHDSGEKNQVKK